jgi:hypothetical protein
MLRFHVTYVADAAPIEVAAGEIVHACLMALQRR